MLEANGFPLDLPDFADPVSLEAWQKRVVQLLDFTIKHGVTTSSTTVTTIASVVIAPLTTVFIESWVLGVLSAEGGSAILGKAMLNVWRGGFYTDVTNVAQIVGGAATKSYVGVNTPLTAEPFTTNLTTSGNTAIHTVTGVASEFVVWRCAMKVFSVSI